MYGRLSLTSHLNARHNYIAYGNSPRPKERLKVDLNRASHLKCQDVLLDDSRRTLQLIELLADQNGRVKNAAVLMMVSWFGGDDHPKYPPDDPSTPEMMRAITTLRHHLGLDGHPTIVGLHFDTQHPHAHLIASNVNPETMRAWTSRDEHYFPVMMRSLRQIARQHGWRNNIPENIAKINCKPSKPTPCPLDPDLRERRGMRPAVLTEARRYLAGDFERARSWEELEALLDESHLSVWLEPRRENGMVVHINDRCIKLSRINGRFSRPKLEKRFGQTWTDYQAELNASHSIADRAAATASPREEPLRERPEPLRERPTDAEMDALPHDHEIHSTSRELAPRAKELTDEDAEHVSDEHVRDGCPISCTSWATNFG